jgi:hypothetical protein
VFRGHQGVRDAAELQENQPSALPSGSPARSLFPAECMICRGFLKDRKIQQE